SKDRWTYDSPLAVLSHRYSIMSRRVHPTPRSRTPESPAKGPGTHEAQALELEPAKANATVYCGADTNCASSGRFFRSLRRIFPVADFGTASTNSTMRTFLYGATRSATHAFSSSGSISAGTPAEFCCG